MNSSLTQSSLNLSPSLCHVTTFLNGVGNKLMLAVLTLSKNFVTTLNTRLTSTIYHLSSHKVVHRTNRLSTVPTGCLPYQQVVYRTNRLSTVPTSPARMNPGHGTNERERVESPTLTPLPGHLRTMVTASMQENGSRSYVSLDPLADCTGSYTAERSVGTAFLWPCSPRGVLSPR